VLNIRDFHGSVITLIFAAKYGNLECVKILLEANCDIGARDIWGMQQK
jgi:hypothetical protein